MIESLPRSDVEFLLVSCCLEETRLDTLQQTIASLNEQAPYIKPTITVFDNASTQPGVHELLKSNFENVFCSDQNVGYWSAIDWWIRNIADKKPSYTYIIESDMIHYAFERIWDCASFLDKNPTVGSMRLHEYSFANRHLYDKDRPHKDSNKHIWQSHHNKVTGEKIKFEGPFDEEIYVTNFLTQLPALNRFDLIDYAFKKIRSLEQFTELDFQSYAHRAYKSTGIVDGGIFHCNPGSVLSKSVTSSWTPESELKKIGYLTTRFSHIVSPTKYNVKRL